MSLLGSAAELIQPDVLMVGTFAAKATMKATVCGRSNHSFWTILVFLRPYADGMVTFTDTLHKWDDVFLSTPVPLIRFISLLTSR